MGLAGNSEMTIPTMSESGGTVTNFLHLQRHVEDRTLTRSLFLVEDAERRAVRLSRWRLRPHKSQLMRTSVAFASLLVIVMLIRVCSTFTRGAIARSSPPRALSDDDGEPQSKLPKLCEGTDEESSSATSPLSSPESINTVKSEPTVQRTNVSRGVRDGRSAGLANLRDQSATEDDGTGSSPRANRSIGGEAPSVSAQGAAGQKRSYSVIWYAPPATSTALPCPSRLHESSAEDPLEGSSAFVAVQQQTAQRFTSGGDLIGGQAFREERQGPETVSEIGDGSYGSPHAARSEAAASYPTLASLLFSSASLEPQQSTSQESEEPDPSSSIILMPGEERLCRLPQVVLPGGGGRQKRFSWESAKLKAAFKFPAVPWFEKAHSLLSEVLLFPFEVGELIDVAEMLAAHIYQKAPGKQEKMAVSQYLRQSASTFLALEALVSALIVLEVPRNDDHWRELMQKVLTDKKKSPEEQKLGRKETPIYTDLANRITEALNILKKGKRPTSKDLIAIKRMLFHSSDVQAKLRLSGWNVWRSDDEAPKGD